jgi:hypothetical protein
LRGLAMASTEPKSYFHGAAEFSGDWTDYARVACIIWGAIWMLRLCHREYRDAMDVAIAKGAAAKEAKAAAKAARKSGKKQK